MIVLTRIDQTQLVVNADEIETIDIAHQSTLTLKSGKKIIVNESYAQIVEKIIEYKNKCFRELLVKIPDINPDEIKST
jgi:flagellar protein FlbD